MSTAEQSNTVESAAERGTSGLFKWTSWVHVGQGAEDCEDRFTGRCDDEEHFHAWVRLPNPYEVRDLQEKARAAQARKLRQLRDPESDAFVVLEDEMDELRSVDKGILVEELVEDDWQEDYIEAIRAVDAIEDQDWEPSEGDEDLEPPKLYVHIDQDREEYERQKGMPETERSADFAGLEKAVAAYGDAVEAAMKERQDPRRAGLMERDLDELIGMVRRRRMEAHATETFIHEFNTWQWFVCTFKPKAKGTPNERLWRTVAQMKYETPAEVINELRAAFSDLESRFGRSRAAGKS